MNNQYLKKYLNEVSYYIYNSKGFISLEYYVTRCDKELKGVEESFKIGDETNAYWFAGKANKSICNIMERVQKDNLDTEDQEYLNNNEAHINELLDLRNDIF